MPRLLLLVFAALLLPAAAAAPLPAPERALYAGDFKKAYALIDASLQGQRDPVRRFELQLRRVRMQQLARISGLPDASELTALAAIKAEATDMPAPLQAQARHLGLVSTYFLRLLAVEQGDFLSLQASFSEVAAQLDDPCMKADALFFSALMPQMQEQVAASAPGLEQARSVAASAGCDLQLSYDLRHLAVVAEEAGDLAKAAALAEESLAIRRRIGFHVLVPYSLLHTADLAQKRGDLKRARAMREEAVRVAVRRKLPAQEGAARAALAEMK
jgi:hypothetical protein